MSVSIHREMSLWAGHGQNQENHERSPVPPGQADSKLAGHSQAAYSLDRVMSKTQVTPLLT